jgi:endogenous inhibitor of DNA gyrase (YacG/DUF329 family)
MSNNKTQPTQKEENQGNDKFPSWDILPPFQFINPRVMAIEHKEETETKQDGQSTGSELNPSTTSMKQILTDDIARPSIQKNIVNCPACGESVQEDAWFCGECGLRLRESTVTDQGSSDPGTYTAIMCPHCGEELEFDESDDKVGEFNCPLCGKDFELLR